MTIHTHRPTVAAIAAALALAAASPATARPFDLNPNAPQVQALSPQISTPIPAHPNGRDLQTSYLAIGGGAIGFVLLGAGGTVIASRRQRRGTTRSTIAA